MIQSVSFKGVYKILLPVYDAAVLNNYLYDKKNSGKKFYADNAPVELFSDIDRNNYTSIESYEADMYILTGKEAQDRKEAGKNWIKETKEAFTPGVCLEKRREIWSRATDKFFEATKNIIENAEESYTLGTSYDPSKNMPKFTIIA